MNKLQAHHYPKIQEYLYHHNYWMNRHKLMTIYMNLSLTKRNYQSWVLNYQLTIHYHSNLKFQHLILHQLMFLYQQFQHMFLVQQQHLKMGLMRYIHRKHAVIYDLQQYMYHLQTNLFRMPQYYCLQHEMHYLMRLQYYLQHEMHYQLAKLKFLLPLHLYQL